MNNVATLPCLKFCTTNLLRTLCTKMYYNRSSFVDCTSKNILVCFIFGSQCICDDVTMVLAVLQWM